MAEEQADVESGEGAEAPEADFRAKYEQMRAHAREWEKKAKANAKAADELEQLKASQMSDMERVQRQYEEERERADRLQAEKDRASWVASVSRETGVPADLLALVAADSEEDLAEKAAGIAERFPQAKGGEPRTVPVVLGDGRHAEEGAPKGDFIREQFMRMRSH